MANQEAEFVVLVSAPIQDLSTPRPDILSRLPALPRNLRRTDKTITKLFKTVHIKRAISRKTLGFRPFRPAEKKFAETLSTHARPLLESSGPLPPEIERNRTDSNAPAFSPAEQGWTRLTKPDHPEHAISSNTLKIAPRRPRKKIAPDHLTA